MLSNYPMDPSLRTSEIYPDPATADYKQLIAFVHDRCKENDGLVSFINSRKAIPGATITRPQLRVSCANSVDTFRFPVREVMETVDMSTFVKEWCPADCAYIDTKAECPLGPSWDLDSFDKLVRTNSATRDMATTLAIAEGSLQSKELLVKLLRNVTKMGDQLRPLYVLAANTATDEGGSVVAEEGTATRSKSLQEELEGAVQGILRKYGAVAENTSVDATTARRSDAYLAKAVLERPAPVHVPHFITVAPAVQAAMSAMGVLAEHLASLLQWISEARDAPYTGNTLSLQYQASRDGWKGDDFRRRCNGQGSMLFILRSDKGYLFGGYTSVGFQQHRKRRDTDANWANARDDAAFVFTLTNPHAIPATKYRCKRPMGALVNCCKGDWRSLWFMGGFGLVSDCNTNRGSGVAVYAGYYDLPHGQTTLTGSAAEWTVSEILGFRVKPLGI